VRWATEPPGEYTPKTPHASRGGVWSTPPAGRWVVTAGSRSAGTCHILSCRAGVAAILDATARPYAGAVIDLHTHSTVSDGSEPPTRVIDLAADAGLTAVALTDHDRLDGLADAIDRGAERGIEVIPGCELSCEHPGTMHLLVYFVTTGDGPLQNELDWLQRARDDRNGLLASRLTDLGLPVSREEMEEESGGTGTGRPHAAAILVRKGVVGSVQEAFDTYLAKGKPAYVPRGRLTPDDALRLARGSGGVAVLAHPLSLGLAPASLERHVGELAGLGLAGMECVYGRYSPAERTGLAAMAGRHGLAVTGGSDFHGTYKPDLSVGTGRGDLAVDDGLLDRLRELAPASGRLTVPTAISRGRAPEAGPSATRPGPRRSTGPSTPR